MIYSGEGTHQTVVGLASDAVSEVSVDVAGHLLPATLKRNAFFWQAPASVTREDIDALVVRQRSGGATRVDLDFTH